jgi:cytochrome b
MSEKNSPIVRVQVWDLPLRLFHWSLVILVAFAWWTWKTDRMEWHRYAGYAVIALLVFRLYWGVFGSATARFANFVRGPGAVWRYIRGRGDATFGHNPLGALSVLALLAALIAQSVTGLYALDDEGLESGPLADTVASDTAQQMERWHGLAFDALLALIALHVLAILFYLLRGDNLLGPMIGGRKRVPSPSTPLAPTPVRASLFSLAIGVLLAAAAFAVLLKIDGG